jgi:hypothetical protein
MPRPESPFRSGEALSRLVMPAQRVMVCAIVATMLFSAGSGSGATRFAVEGCD